MWSNFSTDQRNFSFLLILCFQNAALILLTRYSHAILHEPYSPAVVVFCMEMTKFVISGIYIWNEKNWEIRKGGFFGELLRTSFRMSVPGFTYVVQNTLQFAALKHLDASTFTIFAQLKTLSAAAFAVAMLRQRISLRKWRALVLLVVGAILVQYEPVKEGAVSQHHAERNFSFGLVCVISMVALSGFSGIYLEKYLKDQSNSIYERNFQLGFWGMIFSTFSIITQDLDRIHQHGLFHGFSWLTLLIVGVGAGGGIVVALVVKYTSTIIKGFATSMSIILTSVLSYFIFQSRLGLLFVLGATCVFISIFNYNEEEPKSYKPDKTEATPNLHPIPMAHRDSGATREREGMASSRAAIEV